jgi:hypothetical protein
MMTIKHIGRVLLAVQIAYLPQFAALMSGKVASQTVPFGRVLRLFVESHRRLDLTPKSCLQSFHFTIGSGTKKMHRTGTSKHFVGGSFVEAHVVRDHNACAALLVFSSGLTIYFSSYSRSSFIAMLEPGDASHILVAHGDGICAAGLLTGRHASELGLPDGMDFGVAYDRPPLIFLRIMDFIRTKLDVAQDVKFRSRTLNSVLTAKWASAQGTMTTMHIHFNLATKALFPVRKMSLVVRKGGRVVTTGWISDVGAGMGHHGPIIHRIKQIEPRVDLPWKTVARSTIYRLGVSTFPNVFVHGPADAAYTSLRKRFIKWAMVPPDVSVKPAETTNGTVR